MVESGILGSRVPKPTMPLEPQFRTFCLAARILNKVGWKMNLARARDQSAKQEAYSIACCMWIMASSIRGIQNVLSRPSIKN